MTPQFLEVVVEGAREDVLAAITNLKNYKPGDRSELDRRFQIVITDLEKIHAMMKEFLMNG